MPAKNKKPTAERRKVIEKQQRKLARINQEQARKKQERLAAEKKPEEKVQKKVTKEIKELLKKGKRPRTRKVWHNVKFRRPRTLRLPKNPRYPHRGIPKRRAMDKYAILKTPITSDSAMKAIEEHNTLVFLVNRNANKKQIRNAFKRMYDVKVEKCRTLIRPTGEKKAFIKLPPDVEAVDVATKIGIC